MTRKEIIAQIEKKKSFLCIGLDIDLTKIPAFLLDAEDPIFEFNKAIIDATAEFCVAYKPNTAFYECYGVKGWIALEKTIQYLNSKYPNHFTIADAKRGDIGNTSKMYADAFFNQLNFDAVTVAPYMGEDSVTPFISEEGKWVIVLGLTSNKGALNFQTLNISSSEASPEKLYEKVIKVSSEWGTENNMMYVIGATQSAMFTQVRKIIPNHFLLVPGVGAQGGNLEEVAKFGMNKEIGLLVNSSRAILYASNDKSFASAAAEEAKKTQEEMKLFL